MIDQQKKDIRLRIKQLKKQFSSEDFKAKSKIIFSKIEKLDIFKNSKTILAYWSMPDEVYTHDFINKWVNSKKFLLPVVNGNMLDLKEFTGANDLISGEAFGIGEPVGNIFTNFKEIDLIIIPGMAFDKKYNRLGRGKAFYDKILNEIEAEKLGICFDFQFIDEVPVEMHDVKMDLVIYD